MQKNLIIIHCAATRNGRALAQTGRGVPSFKSAAYVIDGWHAQRGFARDASAQRRFNSDLPAIGYQFVIDTDGRISTGRALDEHGAHTQGYNAAGIGICMVGTDAFTPDQWDSLAQLLPDLSIETGIPIVAPAIGADGRLIGGVCGHRDTSADVNGDGRITADEWVKTCPGFDVATYLRDGLVPSSKHVCGWE